MTSCPIFTIVMPRDLSVVSGGDGGADLAVTIPHEQVRLKVPVQ